MTRFASKFHFKSLKVAVSKFVEIFFLKIFFGGYRADHENDKSCIRMIQLRMKINSTTLEQKFLDKCLYFFWCFKSYLKVGLRYEKNHWVAILKENRLILQTSFAILDFFYSERKFGFSDPKNLKTLSFKLNQALFKIIGPHIEPANLNF